MAAVTHEPSHDARAPKPKARRKGRPSQLRRLFRIVGPGIIAGASDNDPSGIGTYSVAGTTYGFSMLWLAWVTLPMLAAIQNICARIGNASGKGLTTVVKQNYPAWLVYPFCFLLLAANTITIGADLGAMAAGLNLLTGVAPRFVLVPMALLVVGGMVFGHFKDIERVLKWLTLFLLSYVVTGFLTHPDWKDVLRQTFTPQLTLDGGFIKMIVAILGTTLTPYMWFWQTSQEVEVEVAKGESELKQRRGGDEREIRDRQLDINLGAIVSNSIMFFIIMTTGATLFAGGKHDIQSAADAAQALGPLAGGAAQYLFGIGFLGMGLLAIPVLAGSSAYALSEACNWKVGLDRPLRTVPQFYGILALATVVGLSLDFTSINPMDALVLSAMINGAVAPVVLAVIMLVANNPRIMRRHRNGVMTNIFGWLTVAVMALAAAALFVTLF
jgi:NRAMP (natural resistance-associated macrophage protein)-like metal ion transporter